ncbi:Diaminopimelate epimerase [hydrothermal vent metagenome]|uniref:diaminopimelate epimerase n=1 Tax=hydrothermal vent metagenome TaxID=652676 RepID=A0A3B1DK43_9ZZZZ
MGIKFTKMSGSGNDFVIIDNRVPVMADETKRDFARRVCAPKTSVGADGVIFIENSDEANFKWDFYNNDGSSAEMCGNGGRCVARFAYENKIAPSHLSFETTAGIITADVNGPTVKVKLTKPKDFLQDISFDLGGVAYNVDSINTGVPHAIVYCDDLEAVDIQTVGRSIRTHPKFAPAGTNVCWVQKKDGNALRIRTYERGIEAETLACGTGAVASALLASYRGQVEPPVEVETRGGDILKIHFKALNGLVEEVYLEGPAMITFEGTLVEY